MIRKLLYLGDRNGDTPLQTYNFFMGTRSQDEMFHVAVSEKKEAGHTCTDTLDIFRASARSYPRPTRAEKSERIVL